jgi:glycosyltransferase involved in cell wall biosynthesis
MRILAIECELTTLLGGSERSYFDVLTGLQERGHQVTLLYGRPGNLLDGYTQAGVRTVQSDHPLILKKGTQWSDLRSMWSAAARIKKLGSFDVIYINFTEAIPFAFILKLRLNVRIVCHIRIPYFGLSRQILWGGKWVSKFIVINKKLKPVYEGVFNAHGKVKVVYNGIAVPAQLPAIKKKPGDPGIRILYLGRIAPEKGTSELVTAFKTATQQGLKGTLTITGAYVASHSGDYRAELKQVIDSSGVSGLVSFSPPVPDPIRYVSEFDLFVFPSTWDEPFGRTIPEAILAGTPVLARDVGIVREIMVDNPAFVFDTDESLSQKLVSFFIGGLTFNFEAARQTIIRDFNKIRMIEEVEQILMK